jgi:hypothetical protein
MHVNVGGFKPEFDKAKAHNGKNSGLHHVCKGHFTHEPRAVTIEIVRAQKKVSKGRLKTTSKVM